VLLILIPLPLYGSGVVFGVKGFSAWATIGIIWAFGGIAAVVVWPLFESRGALMDVSRGIVKVCFARRCTSSPYSRPPLGYVFSWKRKSSG
jgi:hypothetical protein